MTSATPSQGVRALATVWAVTGVAAILLKAVVALGARGLDTLRGGLGPAETAALLALTALFVWGEGYRALQRRWIPYVIERVRRLRSDPRPGRVALAPLYAMSLMGGPRKGLLRAWAGIAAIVAAVLLVRAFPEPWRGIVDFAVAAALAWGVVALGVHAWRAFV